MNQVRVSLSPHVRSHDSTSRIMLDVLIALVPSCAVGIWFLGVNAAVLLAVSTLSAVLAEDLWCRATKRPSPVRDLSAAVTGLLVGMNLPATAPWWLAVFGSVFAIIVVKQFFGGLGQNFINPAMAARAFLLASWPSRMTLFTSPGAVDAVSSATPLMVIYGKAEGAMPDIMQMLIGNIPGTIGEVSKAALMLGAAYMILRGTISPRIPLIYILTVFFLSSAFAVNGPSFYDGLYSIAAGGLFLGAIFMATDYTTSPITPGGQTIFALGCGVITFVIRRFGSYPDGVTFALLLMNTVTPLIDRYVRPRKYGEVAKAK
jgi:electron transport complex protein RnfD